MHSTGGCGTVVECQSGVVRAKGVGVLWKVEAAALLNDMAPLPMSWVLGVVPWGGRGCWKRPFVVAVASVVGDVVGWQLRAVTIGVDPTALGCRCCIVDGGGHHGATHGRRFDRRWWWWWSK